MAIWNKNELEYLKQSYGVKPVSEICKFLKRSNYSIYGKVQKLKIGFERGKNPFGKPPVLIGEKNPRFTGCELFVGDWLNDATKHHKSILTNNDIIKKYEQQNGLCYFTGDKLIFPKTHKEHRNSATWNASIDRICNKKQYCKSNFNLVTSTINLIRFTNTIKEFYKWCIDIYNYKILKIYHQNKIEIYKHTKGFKGYKNISAHLWHQIMFNAKKRNIDFNINIKEAWNIYESQNGICAISGMPIIFNQYWNDRSSRTASLDRVDSNKPYDVNNIQWVHKKINQMRSRTTVNEFIKEIIKVINFRNLI